MPVEQLNFQGINRAVSDYGNAGACEELINLRPTGTGLVPVKPFSVKMADFQYDKLFIHKAGNGKENYIAVDYDDQNGILEIIYVNGAHGEEILDSIYYGYESEFNLSGLHFASAGNYILFSIWVEEVEIRRNIAFLWDGEKYKDVNADIPDITTEITPSEFTVGTEITSINHTSNTPQEIVEAIKTAHNKLQEKHKTTCFGPVIIAVAYKTTDGKTFWTGQWSVYNPVGNIKENDPGIGSGVYFYINQTRIQNWPNYAEVYKDGFLGLTGSQVNLIGEKLNMKITMPGGSWDEDSSMVSSIEVYTSKPIVYIDPYVMISGSNGLSFSDYRYSDAYAIPQIPYDELGLEGQLLYLQKSIPLRTLVSAGNEGYEFPLEFGGNIQLTNKTLLTDAGRALRYGNILSYNARFHFFDSVKETALEMPKFYYDDGFEVPETGALPADFVEKYVLIVFNDGLTDKEYYVGTKYLPIDQGGPLDDERLSMIVAPSLQIKEVITVYAPPSPALGFIRRYRMVPSTRYNYSIYYGADKMVDASQAAVEAYVEKIDEEGRTLHIFTKEPSAINVTEQYNPFVFNVDNSYLAPGKVLDVQPQMVAVKDVSYGDYPLNVFTDRGVYALLQGDGRVLYSAFKSISNLISEKNSVPTENGTFFIAAGGLWSVAGSTAVLISDALSLGPHKFIRLCPGYKAISEGQYDVETLASQVIFEKYVQGATLSYNRYRDELFVSNAAYDYTYVISLKYRQWFKLAMSVSQDVVGGDLATVPSGGIVNIVDMSDELEEVADVPASVLVHFQTRPFSVGYQYSHVHRLLSMIRANLSTDDLLIVGLYGSDNLQDWKLLSYASRSGIKISQIRTPSAARSWRYYTVCVGGTCPVDTDFGPTIFEYQPVVRRIG